MLLTLRLLRLATVALILGPALSARAQTPAPPPLPPAATPTSYTYGLVGNRFAYLNADSTFNYRFDASAQALMISGENGYLMLSYGSQPADSSEGAPSLSMLQAATGLGGQSYLFKNMFGLPLRGFIPTQLQLGYRYIAPGEERFARPDDAPADGDDEGAGRVAPLHLASAGLALGAGVDARIPNVIPVLENRLAARAFVLVGAGATTNALTELDELGLMGTRELHLEVRLERVLGNQAGVTLGYVYRQQNWAQGTPESARDVLDAFLEPGHLDQKSTQHLIRLGVNF